MYDPTMSEVAPPRKAPISAHVPVSRPNEESRPKPTPTASEDLLARLALPEDSEVETQPRRDNRLEQPERPEQLEYAKIMARLDGLESLLEKHISGEASAKAAICENMETYASTVALNNALMTTSIEVMKTIQADVNRITWHQFETAVNPERTTTVCDDKKSDHSRDQSGAGQSGAGQSGAGQSGGCGWVATKEPIPTQIPGYNSTRIEPNEFQAIKDDGNLKHVWVYINACDEKAHKMRVQSLAALDVSNVYANGGCLFPYMKSCVDVDRFYDFRIKFLVGQHYSHCRPKI